MDMRRLGSTGLVTLAIGLDCLGFVRGCGPVDRAQAVAVVAHALDNGITLIDATDFGAGDVEVLVGRAVRRRRDEVVLATRGGARFSPRGRFIEVDGHPDHLTRDCDGSLRRLGVDHVDVYFLARVDPRVPIERASPRSPAWSRLARSASSDCPKWTPSSSAEPTRSTRSRRWPASTPCLNGGLRG